MLVSGSEEGSLRIWDLRTRACARVVQPWGGGAGAASSSSSSCCPVSSILVVPRGNNYASSSSGPFGLGSASHSRGRGSGSGTDALDLFRPLQRFPNDKPIASVIPILASNKSSVLVRRWEGDENFGQPIVKAQKRARTAPTNTSAMSPVEAETPALDKDESDEDDGFLAMDSSGAPSENNNEDEEKAALRKELEEARATIARWEKVNNKLAKKLEKAKGTGK